MNVTPPARWNRRARPVTSALSPLTRSHEPSYSPRTGHSFSSRNSSDALLAGLAHERRGRIRVDVVEVDLERHEAQRGEARRVADRHVVGGPDRRAGDVGAGGGAHVAGRAFADVTAQRLEHTEGVQGVEQPERVAAAHHHHVRFEDRAVRSAGAVGGDDLDVERAERGRGSVGVLVPVRQRVGDERHLVAGGDVGEGLGGMREHRAAVVGGVGEQKELHDRHPDRPARDGPEQAMGASRRRMSQAVCADSAQRSATCSAARGLRARRRDAARRILIVAGTPAPVNVGGTASSVLQAPCPGGGRRSGVSRAGGNADEVPAVWGRGLTTRNSRR